MGVNVKETVLEFVGSHWTERAICQNYLNLSISVEIGLAFRDQNWGERQN